MKAYRFSPRGCLVGIVSVLLAIGVTVQSVNYQRPADPVCNGSLGAGFPVSILCDDVGGSPIANYGKIDAGDWFNLNPLGFLIDVLFYTVLFWVAWLTALSLFRLVHRHIQAS